MSHLAAAPLLKFEAEVDPSKPDSNRGTKPTSAAQLFGKTKPESDLHLREDAHEEVEIKIDPNQMELPLRTKKQPDTLKGSNDEGETSEEPVRVIAEEKGECHGSEPIQHELLEMRQVAGLSSGTCLALHEGTFEFSEFDDQVGFYISVHGANRVTAIPSEAPVFIDEVEVAAPTRVGNSVLSVGNACFTVRQPRPQVQAVPDLTDKAELAPIPVPSTLRGVYEEGQSATLDPESWEFIETIREIRSVEAEKLRLLHPDPEQLIQRIDGFESNICNRSRSSALFGQIALAYTNLPWQPIFDRPSSIPESLYDHIRELSCLPLVPYTANIVDGPIGIVGSRPAALAMARYLLLASAALSTPGTVELAIVTSKSRTEDWAWSAYLPDDLVPDGHAPYRLTVADGFANYIKAGHEHDPNDNPDNGLVVLAESAAELPYHCSSVLEIARDGTCAITSQHNEIVTGTPIGVTEEFAITLANRLSALFEKPAPTKWLTA